MYNNKTDLTVSTESYLCLFVELSIMYVYKYIKVDFVKDKSINKKQPSPVFLEQEEKVETSKHGRITFNMLQIYKIDICILASSCVNRTCRLFFYLIFAIICFFFQCRDKYGETLFEYIFTYLCIIAKMFTKKTFYIF